MSKVFVRKMSLNKIFWDYFETFKPAPDFSKDNNKFYCLIDLDENSIEYKYVAYKFGTTFMR